MRRPEPDALLAAIERLLQAAGTNAASLLGEEVRAQRQWWKEDRPQIVLVSGFAAGKTTLLKHWFGLSQLPTGRTATTAAATRIVHGDPDEVILRYRQAVEVPLRLAGIDVVDALQAYADAPYAFHIAGFGTVEGQVFRPEQIREIIAVARQDPGEAPAGIVVRFRERPAERYSLAAMPEDWLADQITSAVNALALAEVVCHARHRVLRHVSMLDTAGYGAAETFHQKLSAAVLSRRPETTIVLVDARRLDEPRFRHVLADVWAQVRLPEEVDSVLIGLTHWQSFLSSEAYDEGDTAAEFDPRFHEQRLGRKRTELDRLLEERPWPTPMLLPLEMGPRPIGAAARSPTELLELAVRRAHHSLRPSRRETTCDLADRAADVVQAAAEAASADHARLRGEADRLADRARALQPAARELMAMIGRCENAMEAGVRAERSALLAEVDTHRKRSEIMKYLREEYASSRAQSATRLSEIADAERLKLTPVLGDGLLRLMLPPGPDATEQQSRITKVENVFWSADYAVLVTLEMFAPKRIANDLRENARSLLRGYIRTDTAAFDAACNAWSAEYRARGEAGRAEIERKRADAVARAYVADQAAGDAAEWSKTLAALLAQARTLQAEAARL